MKMAVYVHYNTALETSHKRCTAVMLTHIFGRRHFATISGNVKIFLANAHFFNVYVASYILVSLSIHFGYAYIVTSLDFSLPKISRTIKNRDFFLLNSHFFMRKRCRQDNGHIIASCSTKCSGEVRSIYCSTNIHYNQVVTAPPERPSK